MPSPTPAMQSPGLLRRMARLLLLASLPMTAAVAAEDTAPAGPLALKPGQFLWHPEIAPDGPVVLVVSLDQQLAYVYRNGIAIGISTISSGKPGKDTPTGVFTILQKNKDHKSNLYNNAPMPYMQRLTWDGIALHGGTLPGYPASHGCVRLPHPFAAKVYGITRTGDTVVVSDARAAPTTLVYPGMLAPVTAHGLPLAVPEDGGPGYRWDAQQPEFVRAKPGGHAQLRHHRCDACKPCGGIGGRLQHGDGLRCSWLGWRDFGGDGSESMDCLDEDGHGRVGD